MKRFGFTAMTALLCLSTGAYADSFTGSIFHAPREPRPIEFSAHTDKIDCRDADTDDILIMSYLAIQNSDYANLGKPDKVLALRHWNNVLCEARVGTTMNVGGQPAIALLQYHVEAIPYGYQTVGHNFVWTLTFLPVATSRR